MERKAWKIWKWLVKDLHEELKSRGRTGGASGNVVIKTDGEASIVALRDALARYHGGIVTPEVPPTGESQAHGSAGANGKRMRGLVQVYKDQIEERASVKLQASDVILLWMIRWAAMVYSRYKVGEDVNSVRDTEGSEAQAGGCANRGTCNV